VSGASIKLLRYQIARQGYGISFAFDDSPSFAYTVGLEETFRHPELVVSGLDYEMSQRVLKDLIDLIRSGAGLTGEDCLQSAGSFTVLPVAVPQPVAGSYLKEAAEYYGDCPFRALQVLWPDEEGRFPTEESCSEQFRLRQVVLSERG
jgi:hypothetical protein